jgi:uncharacterized membrane protein YcaP (DUF421 family)
MWWFDSADAVGRVIATGAVCYLALVLMLRISGKRTLSKLNAFDLVVTVAMGSTLSAALLSSEVPVADGVTGFLVLVLGQWAITRLSILSPRFAEMVRSQPRVLLRDGEFVPAALKDERVTREEVLAAIRQAGLPRLQDVGAVVLETDGSVSVLPGTSGKIDVLEGVRS